MCDYQCTSVSFIKLSNRIESNNPNRNAVFSTDVIDKQVDITSKPIFSTFQVSAHLIQLSFRGKSGVLTTVSNFFKHVDIGEVLLK